MSKPTQEFNLAETVYVDFTPTKDDLSEWAFKFPDYNQAAVDDLKEAVPPECRGYDPPTYTWTVTEEWAQTAAEIIQRSFARVQILWAD